MSENNHAGPMDESKPDVPLVESESEPSHAESSGDGGGISPHVVLGIVVLAGIGVLMQYPDLRKAGTGVLQDRNLQKMVCRGVAASWKQHGGPAALANTFLR